MSRHPKRKVWRRWLLAMVVLLPGNFWMMARLGTTAGLLTAFGLLGLVLAYQRYVRKRAWREILWGIYAEG